MRCVQENTMTHRILFLDAETYYDKDYSLKKMTPAEYILDARFELIGCAAKYDNLPAEWIDAPDFPAFLASVDRDNTTTVTFNALFDNCIFAWRYGFVPRRMLCAMRMAVALRGHTLPSASLASVARRFGVGEKGTEIDNVLGKRRAEILAVPPLYERFKHYALNDVDLCARVFFHLAGEFPESERRVMDLVLRCCVQPRFQVDRAMLVDHLEDIEKSIKLTLLSAGADPEDPEAFIKTLRSNMAFEQLLKTRGVDVEYKPSTTNPDVQIPAFAKTDEFMANLLEHDDPEVQALAAARLGARSTIEQTRGLKLLRVSSLDWSGYRSGNWLPIPLRYSGAHTHRLSGDWGMNMQNLPSGRGQRKSKLRKALIAGPDEEIVVADLAQIECRVNAWFCGQENLLKIFEEGGDPYSDLATDVFGYAVTKESAKTTHALERFIGKNGELGLGFGCGADKFYNMVLRSARGMGMDMSKLAEVWTPGLAQQTVDVYRTKRYHIKQTWSHLQVILDTAWCGLTGSRRIWPVEIGHGYVLLPNGMKMNYDVITPIDRDDLKYKYGRTVHRMYGPKLLENIVQALARIIVMNAALRLECRGYRFAMQSHDELSFVVPKDDVETAKKIIYEEFVRRPSWGLRIPLNAEVNSGRSYGDAK